MDAFAHAEVQDTDMNTCNQKKRNLLRYRHMRYSRLEHITSAAAVRSVASLVARARHVASTALDAAARARPSREALAHAGRAASALAVAPAHKSSTCQNPIEQQWLRP